MGVDLQEAGTLRIDSDKLRGLPDPRSWGMSETPQERTSFVGNAETLREKTPQSRPEPASKSALGNWII